MPAPGPGGDINFALAGGIAPAFAKIDLVPDQQASGRRNAGLHLFQQCFIRFVHGKYQQGQIGLADRLVGRG